MEKKIEYAKGRLVVGKNYWFTSFGLTMKYTGFYCDTFCFEQYVNKNYTATKRYSFDEMDWHNIQKV